MPKSIAVLVLIAFNVVTLEVHNCCEALQYGARLASFPKPDFRISFTLFSQQGFHSFKEIRHGLNVNPFYVRVYGRARNTNGHSFCFNGVGSSQASPKISNYGGIVYAYNSMFVRVWAPTQYRNHSNGRIIYLKDGWGRDWRVHVSSEAEVVVEVWKSGPEPTLQLDITLDTIKSSFSEVKHQLGQIPERISVTVTPDGWHYPKANPNRGYWFKAIGSSQNPNPTAGFGGVIFAYNAKRIRLWAADGNLNATGCIFVGHGWGNEKYAQYSKRCLVRIKLWTNLLPVPVYQSEWRSLTAQSNSDSFAEVSHNLGILPSHVIVQLRVKSGINLGFIFEGQGSAQSGDNNVSYGGATFAYNENSVRIWAPNKNDGSSKGFAVLVKDGWGDGKNLQFSVKVDYCVIVHSSPCDSNFETTVERDECINTKYLSYQWTNFTQWSDCSSICNNGTRKRKVQGCKVTSRKTILACNFERDFCGWTSTLSNVAPMQWVRTNQATPQPKTGPEWGYPKGSYYIYTNSTNFKESRKGILTSPRIYSGKKCRLQFFWNMYGRDVGDLKVHVKHRGYFRDTGWGMKRSHGELLWRQAVINLQHYIVQKVRFIHELPTEKGYGHHSCPSGYCPQANVAISNIKLKCERDYKVLDAEVCSRRVETSASCEHYAVNYATKGPAYTEEQVTISTRTFTYVKALGNANDTIASYRFRVLFRAHYYLWAQSFNTYNTVNSFSFRVNDGEWHLWHTVMLTSSPLWQNYRYQTFLLNPGIHVVTLQQVEEGFRLDRLILAPSTVTQWADLGMQSRHIPDSYLYSFPHSNPPAKEGRLNGVDAWCSSDHNSRYVYLEIQLPDLALVSRVAVQGGQNIVKRSNNYWVTSFEMKVSVENGFFTWYRDRTNDIKVFKANRDAGGIVTHLLQSPVPARAVRIYPKKFENWICMRTELYGIYILPEMCATAPKHPDTSSSCVGDRDCGKNAECSKANNKIPLPGFNSTKSLDGLETCRCHHGYHGPSCQHYGCNPNPCQNNGKCFKKSNKFTCHCPVGYHGNVCQFPCPPGRYGNNCSSVCHCNQHGSCDIVTGNCNCNKGYYGLRCAKECPGGFYGYNCSQRCQCKRGSSCDKVNGVCNCTTGWTGRFCESPCRKDLWGYGCRNKCNCSKAAMSCDRFTGKCLCPPGKMGSQCLQECRDGMYGLNCTNLCLCDKKAVCSKADGTCSCMAPGVTGVLCDMPCSGGTYGRNCALKCSCHNGASCDRFNGACRCPSGRMGRFCDQNCPQGYWGNNCSLRCHCLNGAQCDPQTGLCSCHSAKACKCMAGWMGRNCRVQCPEGRWGQKCEKMCHCANQGLCDKVNGSCLCKPGFIGAKCENHCPKGYYGSGCTHMCPCNPKRSISCNGTSGICQCRAGWQGRSCDIPCSKAFWGKHCKNNCKCVNGSCNRATGICSCYAGVQPGQLCDKPCKTGFFGIGCKYSCSCKQGSCDAVTGKCTCRRGWYGVDCDSRCNGTYNQPLCDKQCKCHGMSSCNGNGSCQCLPGWTGPNCNSKCLSGYYGYKCKAKCPACVNSNGSCDSQTGMCHCLPGYIGNTCADACPVGYYGDQCKLKCNCSNGGVCNHIDSSCSCAPGWTGRNCAQECPDGKYGPDCKIRCLCANGICDKISGRCSCPEGYHGNTCSSPCPVGTFGLGCQRRCDCHNNESCDSVTGVCQCTPGWIGARCSSKCSRGFHGASCKSRCNCPTTSSCDPITGTCLCPPGKQGPLCLEACNKGFFGANCSQLCKCKPPHSCHPVNGSCACNRGWTGANCTDPCPAGWYGMGCISKCACDRDVTKPSGPCDHVTGQCNCKPRYYGRRCRDECKEGFYGVNCSKQCNCQNGGHCDFIDGTCTCPPGYLGSHCEHRCTEGFYGVNCSTQCRCTKHHFRKCNTVDGTCACLDGYIGILCEDMCPAGKFGTGCRKKCSCKNEAYCDHVTGHCRCTAGHSGKNCDKPCPSGWYGENCASKCLCENFAECNQFNGSCICAPGYQGQRCERPCLEGRYGLNCVKLCDCNPQNTDSCNRVSGKCICRAGTIGKRCDEPCKDGFYGKGCKMPCPECSKHVIGACHKEHGHCACSNGYQSYLCLDSCPVGFYGPNCQNACVCRRGSICHHVNGRCLDIQFSKISMVVNQQVELFQDKDQRRNFRIGLENLMYKYFDVYTSKRQTLLSTVSSFAAQLILRADSNSTPAETPTKSMPVTSLPFPTPIPRTKHDFSVRIIHVETVRITASQTGTRITWVLFDNYTVINASTLQRIIDKIDPAEISEAIATKYYVGSLYTESKPIPLWVIGLISGSGFMLIMGFLALFKLMRKKRRARRGSPQYRRAKTNQPEFEMQPCIGRSPTYPLAFDNPYYDVVAVMGLDDDIEEDYYNPLYDDVSVYSDSNYNSSTDESLHKENLINSMVLT